MLQNQVQDHDQLVFWMTAKRLFFFAATGLLLYLYLVRQFRRKAQAYDELHGSEQRLNRALEAVRDGLWDWDLVTDRMFVSPGYAALIGLAPEELGDPIETWKKRLHPEEYATVLEAHRNHLQGLTDNLDHIYRLRHKDGDYRWIHSRGRVLRDALGKPLLHRRGPRHHPAAAQEDHLRQAAAVFDSTREGVLVTDAQAVIVHVNPSFERITGYRSEDVLGKTRRSSAPAARTRRSTSACGWPCASRTSGAERSGTVARAARSTRSGCTSARCATTRAN